MSKAMWGVLIIFLSIITIGIVNIVQSYTSGKEADYYLLKETSEAAMLDSVDIGYYRMTGHIKIDKEKFVESFVRRFAQNVNPRKSYDLKFYAISELPPKVSISVDTYTTVTFNSESLQISNKLDSILETKYDENNLIDTKEEMEAQ